MTVNIGDIIQLTLTYTQPSASIAQNVFHWVAGATSAPDSEVMDELEDWVNNDWGAQWAPVAGVPAVLDAGRVSIMNTNGTVDRVLGVLDFSIVGSGGSAIDVAAVSGFIRLFTNEPKQRGRKYVPFVSDANLISGLLSSGTMAQMALLLAEWIAVLTTTGGLTLTPGLLSRTLLAFEPFISTAATTNVPAYQRRRKPGVGI